MSSNDETIVWGISADDIAKNRLVDAPSWLPTEITECEVKDDSSGEAKLVRFTYKVFAGDMKGIENSFIFFSEKVPVMMEPLLAACGFARNDSGGFSVPIGAKTMVGKKFRAHWVRGTYKNKPVNQVDDYQALED